VEVDADGSYELRFGHGGALSLLPRSGEVCVLYSLYYLYPGAPDHLVSLLGTKYPSEALLWATVVGCNCMEGWAVVT